MLRPKPNELELQKTLIAAREQCKLRLKMAGYEDADHIPVNVINVCVKETFGCLDIKEMMPEFFASMESARTELQNKWDIALDDTRPMSERVLFRAEVETQLKNEPWMKNVLTDFPSALRSELAEIRKEFLARVKMGKK